jgi:hypothetical protein
MGTRTACCVVAAAAAAAAAEPAASARARLASSARADQVIPTAPRRGLRDSAAARAGGAYTRCTARRYYVDLVSSMSRPDTADC